MAMNNIINSKIFFHLEILTFLWDIPKNFTGSVKFSNGNEEWYLNGFLHRTDGPAVEYSNGYKAWYLNGVGYFEKKWEKLRDFNQENGP